jgi:hypothetical protein
MKPTYDRSRVMKTAHADWRIVRGKPGWTFARCLKLAWAVERKRVAGPEYYQPRVTAVKVISASGKSRDFIWVSAQSR